MSRIYSEQEEFASNHEYFEMSAFNLFDEIYLANNDKLEYHVLAYPYEEVFRAESRGLYISDAGKMIPLDDKKARKKKEAEWKKENRELLCVAYRGRCMKFMSHPACQNYIKTRWASENVKKLFTPWKQQTAVKKRTPAANCIKKVIYKFQEISISTLFWPPRSKFIIHVGFKIFYLVFFAVFLLKKPWRKMTAKDDGKYHIIYDTYVLLFFYVLVTLLCEIVSQFHKVFYLLYEGYEKGYKNYRAAFWWERPFWPVVRSIFGISFVVICTISVSISSVEAVMIPITEILLTICFVISTITTLKFLSVTDYFGPKLQLIKKMANSILKYMLILSVFWVLYAICYLSLTEGGEADKGSIIWKIFQSGAFEIFGELKDADRVGEIQNCSEIVLGMINATHVEQWRCFFQSTLIPPFLFLYMMTATIMLINIFTAMLSHEYETTNEMAGYYSKFYKYEMLARFESKKLFPRPFNIILFLGWLIYSIIKKCRSKYFVCNCCAGLSEKGPLKYLNRWFTSSRKWGSSPRGINVNETAVDKLTKNVLSERTSHDFLEAVLKYVNKKKAERSSRVKDTENLQEAEEIFNGLVNQYTTFLTYQTIKIEQKIDRSATTSTSVFDERNRTRTQTATSYLN